MIYLMVDIILDYLKKTVHNLFTITTSIQGDVLCKKSSKTLNKILEKYLWKSSVFIKVAGSKKQFIHKYFSRILLKF